MSIKSFPYYKHLLQENYVEYKYIFLPLLKLVSKLFVMCLLLSYKKYVCIPRSFLVLNVCKQGKNLCSSCILFSSQEVFNLRSSEDACKIVQGRVSAIAGGTHNRVSVVQKTI